MGGRESALKLLFTGSFLRLLVHLVKLVVSICGCGRDTVSGRGLSEVVMFTFSSLFSAPSYLPSFASYSYSLHTSC